MPSFCPTMSSLISVWNTWPPTVFLGIFSIYGRAIGRHSCLFEQDLWLYFAHRTKNEWRNRKKKCREKYKSTWKKKPGFDKYNSRVQCVTQVYCMYVPIIYIYIYILLGMVWSIFLIFAKLYSNGTDRTRARRIVSARICLRYVYCMYIHYDGVIPPRVSIIPTEHNSAGILIIRNSVFNGIFRNLTEIRDLIPAES